MKTSTEIRQVAYIGAYPPRDGGLATFTFDLANSDAREHSRSGFCVFAINERSAQYPYPKCVRGEIEERDGDSLAAAARRINVLQPKIDVVSLHFEDGFFGGEEAEGILVLLETLERPVVTTVHSALRRPTPPLLRLPRRIIDLSDRVVVMSERGRDLIEQVYGADPERVDVIPHGIHPLPVRESSEVRGALGLDGRFVVLNAGGLSRYKRLEDVIQALPRVVAGHPEVLFLVVGETGPRAGTDEGKSYCDERRSLARSLGMGEQVLFHDDFVLLEELQVYVPECGRRLCHSLPAGGVGHFQRVGLRHRGGQGGGDHSILVCPGTAGGRRGGLCPLCFPWRHRPSPHGSRGRRLQARRDCTGGPPQKARHDLAAGCRRV